MRPAPRSGCRLGAPRGGHQPRRTPLISERCRVRAEPGFCRGNALRPERAGGAQVGCERAQASPRPAARRRSVRSTAGVTEESRANAETRISAPATSPSGMERSAATRLITWSGRSSCASTAALRTKVVRGSSDVIRRSIAAGLREAGRQVCGCVNDELWITAGHRCHALPPRTWSWGSTVTALAMRAPGSRPRRCERAGGVVSERRGRRGRPRAAGGGALIVGEMDSAGCRYPMGPTRLLS